MVGLLGDRICVLSAGGFRGIIVPTTPATPLNDAHPGGFLFWATTTMRAAT